MGMDLEFIDATSGLAEVLVVEIGYLLSMKLMQIVHIDGKACLLS